MPNEIKKNDINHMSEILVDNIFLKFGGEMFQQAIVTPMVTTCVSLLVDLILYSHETVFM